MAYEDVRATVVKVMPSAVDSLGEDLSKLKECASRIVEGLAKNELSLDVEGLVGMEESLSVEGVESKELASAGKKNQVGWLTCAKIERADIPWKAGMRETF